MSKKKEKSLWGSVFLLVMLVLCCFFPFLVIIFLLFVFSYLKKGNEGNNAKGSLTSPSPQPRTWKTVT